ncbi:MAG: YdiU family protein [Opitutales bacterium]|nr:YdiU family protein [Opitutales bacterium]
MRKNDTLEDWPWEHTYARLPARCFSWVKPTPVSAPRLFILNEALADGLGLGALRNSTPESLAAVFSGNRPPSGAEPLAMAYAGHQYGHFVVLGDGRAILLGEITDPAGNLHDIQLKGAGTTPYSRGGDGRAALGPMLREFLISEAMAALGIPTTRSLAVIETGERVLRREELPGAILVRTAGSHLRVGTFALFAALADRESLQALLDYTLRRHYSGLTAAPNPALALLGAVVQRQADLVAQWMAVGFVHGVLNTDNVALSGETIDYGPCAFLDRYHESAVYSSIDRHGRYAYGRQPAIMGWNLARFAESLLPLIDANQPTAIARATEVLEGFGPAYTTAWIQRMGRKLGLPQARPGDKELIEDGLALLEEHRLDFTNSFRALSGDDNAERLHLDHPAFLAWRQRLDARISEAGLAPAEIQEIRDAANPRQIPRNHAVQRALDAAEAGDSAPFFHALSILRQPFAPAADSLFSATPRETDQAHTTFCGT